MKTLKQLNLVSLHNNQITCIDFFSSELYKEKGCFNSNSNNIYYLATGSLDNLVHIVDITKKIDAPFDTLEKITLNDHEAPITGLIFNISNLQNNNNKVNLITYSIDNKIKFYCINSIKSIQLIQSFMEDNLQTYSMSWNFERNKIITGHNGKISVWKTYGCRPFKIFDVKLKNNEIEHFRITLDSTGQIIATSCNDKYIRIRSAFDGHLFCKIPIAESISSLYFCMNNQYLIASSIEGYIYFFKIETEKILNMIKEEIDKQGGDPDDNDDHAYIQDNLKGQIYNKIKILEKLLQNEMEYSKKEQIIFLIEKMKNNEDLKIEDLRTLDSYYQENTTLNKAENSNTEEFVDLNNKQNIEKKILNINSQIIFNSNNEINSHILNKNLSSIKKTNFSTNEIDIISNKSEIINLREDAENNKDENFPSFKEDEENRNSYLTKSIMFEKCLKENINIQDNLKKSIIPSSRVSLSDGYYNKLILNVPKSDIMKNVFKKAEVENNNKKEGIKFFIIFFIYFHFIFIKRRVYYSKELCKRKTSKRSDSKK